MRYLPTNVFYHLSAMKQLHSVLYCTLYQILGLTISAFYTGTLQKDTVAVSILCSYGSLFLLHPRFLNPQPPHTPPLSFNNDFQ